MTWYSPIFFSTDEYRAARGIGGIGGVETARARANLGSARASGQWTWTTTTPPERARSASTPSLAQATAMRPGAASEGACVRAPAELLGQMSAAARAMGRSESEVWVEAAREWLRKREGEPGAPPAAAAPSVRAVGQPRRRDRIWDDIDALLIGLRAPATGSEREGASAA